MSLPLREYYDIDDLAARWGIGIKDVRYYVEHGHLMAKTWISKQVVKLYVMKKTVDGESAFVARDPKTFEGYAVLAPEIIRAVFKDGTARAVRFSCPAKESFYKVVQTDTAPTISSKDLVVSRREMTRFEEAYQISAALCMPDGAAQRSMSFPGRPSVMHKIMAELQRRQRAGETESSLKQESEALLIWAQNILGLDAQVPKLKSIQNAIRDAYRDHLYATHGISQNEKIQVS